MLRETSVKETLVCQKWLHVGGSSYGCSLIWGEEWCMWVGTYVCMQIAQNRTVSYLELSHPSLSD